MVLLPTRFLETTEPPSAAPVALPAGLRLDADRLDPAHYLALYRAVGGDIQWDDRLRMRADDLVAFLAAAGTVILVLEQAGARIGLFEAVDQGEGIFELANFGLVPAVRGRGFGPALLDHGLRHLWRRGARRIWLHTDTNDHPAALVTYRNAGFRLLRETLMEFPD